MTGHAVALELQLSQVDYLHIYGTMTQSQAELSLDCLAAAHLAALCLQVGHWLGLNVSHLATVFTRPL